MDNRIGREAVKENLIKVYNDSSSIQGNTLILMIILQKENHF